MLLVYAPPPVPFVVFEFAVVGLVLVLQQIPRAVTPELQSPEIFPPEEAVVEVIEVMVVVEAEGNTVPVVKGISAPYEVPVALVAYALT